MKFSVKTLLLGIALFAVIAASVSWYLHSAAPAAPLDISYDRHGTYTGGLSDTHEFYAELKLEDVSKLPKWDRRNPSPPVTAIDAMVIAQRYRDQLVTAKQFPERSRIIETKLIPLDSRNHIWIWTVAFRVEQIGNPIEEMVITVLMDGKVVPFQIQRRVDTGFPPPDQEIVAHPSAVDDTEVLRVFIERLNSDRKHAGQTISLTGVLSRIPRGHEDLVSGRYYHFTTDEGVVLICEPPGGWALRLNQKLSISGKLLGYRDLDNRDESWDGVFLHPGIQLHRVGVIRDPSK